MKPHFIYLLLALSLTLSAPVRASRPDMARTDTVTVPIYPVDELKLIRDTLHMRLRLLDNDTVRQNFINDVPGFAYIRIRLIRATEQHIEQFRRTVMDSPVFIFDGVDCPDENPVTAPADTLGVSLRVLTSVIPLSAGSIALELVNRSDSTVFLESKGFMTTEEAPGLWIDYPGRDAYSSIFYKLPPRSVHRFSADLFPLVNDPIPGRVRYFHRMDIGSAHDVLLMSEFRFTDVSAPTLLPPTTKAGLTSSDARTEQVKVYEITDQMPEFPGGDKALIEYIQTNTPRFMGVQGRVIVQFVVDTDGTVTNVKVLRSADPWLDEQALHLIRAMPRWIPGRHKGRLVCVRYVVPVVFRLQ